MKVNKELMARARFDRKTVSELTVAEFRSLMQQCFDADRNELECRKLKAAEFNHALRMHYDYGTPFPKQS